MEEGKKRDDKLRFLQLAELGILKEYISFCEENNLQYYLTYGTLLGAKRHAGFIPWDDDIDVAMPREDYDRFCRLCSDSFVGRYKFRHYQYDNSYNSYVPRIEDSRITIIDSFRNTSKAWIDIFPVDGMPAKNQFGYRIHKFKLLFVRNCINMARMASGVEFWREDRSRKELVILKFLSFFNPGRFMDTMKLFKCLDNLLKKYDYKTTGNCVNFMGEKFKDECSPSVYGNGRTLCFETIMMNVPEKTEELLVQLYGDYMKLPPENERNLHNFYDVYEVQNE